MNKKRMNKGLLLRCLSALLIVSMTMPMMKSPQALAASADQTGQEQVQTQAASGNTYYVSANGRDDQDGLSQATAWKTLDKVNLTRFGPGDRILFKAGDVWNGSIKLRDVSGTKEAPIVFSHYGDLAQAGRPVLNGNGTTTTEEAAIVKNYTGVKDKTMSATIDVVNGSYLEFSNLEITNNNPDVVSQRAGINIRTASTTTAEWEANPHQGITIKNNYIHDVDGNPKGWKIGSGGILLLGNISDVLVEGNTVKRVDIEGIRNAGLYKEGDVNANFPRVLKNVKFNNNYVEEVQGDGFVMSNIGSEGRMEYNTVVKHSAKNVGNVNYAGLWVIGVKDMIMQYNEVYGGIYGYNDGQAFDVDMFCEGTLYQYNYSHSNRGGFILFMSGSKNSVVRYNVSVNDGDGRYIFHYLPTGSADAPLIHNNTFFTDANINTKLMSDSGKYMRLYNNIFYSKANTGMGTETFAGGEVKNNIFYPGTNYQNAKFTGISFKDNLFTNPKFARPGEEPKDLIQAQQSVFDVNRLNGYKLLSGSPAIDAGLDMTAMTPSVWSPAAVDFFRNPITNPAKVDIGAHEFANDEPTEQSPEIVPQSITIDRTDVSLYAGHVGMSLDAVVAPANAWFKTVTWSSSNPSVATVSPDGYVTPMVPGEATVTAVSTVNPNIKGEARVRVLVPSAVTSYKITSDVPEITVATTQVQLRLEGVTEGGNTLPHAPYYQVNYKSGQPGVAVDAQTGKLEVKGDLTGVKAVNVTAEVQEYKDIIFTQSFESGWGDFVPETGTSITTGTISDKVAFQGKQSALFTVGNGSNAIQKLFGATQQGIVSMMLYDDGSRDTKTRVVAHVGNARTTLLAGMGLLYDGGTYGSLDYYSVRVSSNSQAWEATTVKRSKGWHELKWDYTSGTDLKMYIDGQLVKSTTVIKNFDRIVLGFLWDSANGRTFAFDNIKYALSDAKLTYQASLSIPVISDVKELATTLTGNDTVQAGADMNVNFGLKNVASSVYAQDVTIQYDPAAFDFISATSIKDRVSIVEKKVDSSAGKLRLIVASEGEGSGVSGTESIIELSFRAKRTDVAKSALFTVKQMTVADGEGVESIAAASSLSVQITPNDPGIPGDMNQDGKYSIGDLAIIAAHYGETSASPNWSQIAMGDIDHNHVIDINDLAWIASQILK
ncbi:cohesin domain-containing protein [Paenibacillus guangzhouensis]|uniref:cohesin domain-containing protein n=1 Tax=Paenibacillus guangzhouensis TaxID=1473112 RepID=UPI00187B146A|nr:cohesin domain-containing protein [Paenibacillus guangzhouensis]